MRPSLSSLSHTPPRAILRGEWGLAGSEAGSGRWLGGRERVGLRRNGVPPRARALRRGRRSRPGQPGRRSRAPALCCLRSLLGPLPGIASRSLWFRPLLGLDPGLGVWHPVSFSGGANGSWQEGVGSPVRYREGPGPQSSECAALTEPVTAP